MKKARRTVISQVRDLWKTHRARNDRRGRRPTLRFESLESRLALAHAPTDHIHPFLTILLDGQQVPIPANIGLDTAAGKTYNPHTHDALGKIHIGEEGLPAGLGNETRLVTLKDFFDVWRTTSVGTPANNPNANFDSTHIMDKTADATHVVRLYVNGDLNTQFENYVPEDADRVVISYESTSAAGTPTFEPITPVTLLAGSPVYLALEGSDPQNQALTYTVTSSNPALVTGTIPTGNPSVKMTVQNFGEMVFQLFQDKAPRPANRVIELANQNFYDGLTFHRVIDNFVIQGGDPNGTGTGGSQLGNFDDQFHVDLQHNSTGLLSYAKSGDDTNNSQFFITEGPQRHLDFNHSIFGKLVEGENVRDLISNVATDANGKPTTTVTMTDVSVFNDTQNNVLMLKAAEGATGSANITVTVSDPDGHTFARTFLVTIQADTVNGGPFLNDITNVRTTVNVPATIPLASQDAEGNAVLYSAVKADSVASTVNVNPQTGVVTVTPPAGFVGTMQVKATVQAGTDVANDTNDKSDNQVFSVFVAPSAPTSVDLQSASDSGFSNSDNLTNQKNSLQFLVSGVTANAIVQLKDGQTVIGTATVSASGTTVLVTTNVALNDGVHSITATQSVNSIASDPSAALGMTVDSTAPSNFSSTPPTEAQVATQLTYNAQNSEEGNAGFAYSLITPPAGATIDGATGVVSWTPIASQIGSQTFGISATDAAGNVATQTVNVNVADASQVSLRLAITDINGNAKASLNIGETFQLRAFVQDRRANPQGVFSFYSDVEWDSTKATVDGPIEYSTNYNNIKSGTVSPGLLDEIGATSASISPVGGDEFRLFTIQMKATASGALTFTSNRADSLPAHNVLVFGSNSAIDPLKIGFGSATTNIQSLVGANNDTFNVNEDTTNNSLSPLTNDTKPPGFSGELTIAPQLGATNHGGTVTVSADNTKILYTPAPNFVGTETFTYTAVAGADTSVGTITVQVANVNDPPTAVNDAFNATEEVATDLDLLNNDTDIDPNDSRKITVVGTPSQGGTVTIDARGELVVYKSKADFTGTETFTYTIADLAGTTSTATATVTVVPFNDPPTATNDSATVVEDSLTNTLTVLANDSFAPDTNETLTIATVGTTNNATVTIAADKLSLNYVPKLNFQGTDTFTYSISDGNGGSATGTVTVTVTNVNDSPTAAADTLNVLKNSTVQKLDVLANDSSNPDPTEVLTIQSVTQGTQGGVLAVAQDGKSVNYTPVQNFLGTETFTYTINDGHGGTATATGTVTVVDFRPSSLSGFAFIDGNNDGVRQTYEGPLAGIQIKLIGTDTVSNAAVQKTAVSGPDGAYTFTDLAPGNYKIQQVTPPFLVDGKDAVGSQGGALSSNDEISVQIAENTVGTNNNFGETGRQPQFVSIRDFLASTPMDFVLVTARPAEETVWYATSTAPTSITNVQVQNGMTGFQIFQGDKSATVSTTSSHVTNLGNSGNDQLYRIADLSSLNFQTTGGGEGEGPSASVSSASQVTFVSPSVAVPSNESPLGAPLVSAPATPALSIASFTSRAALVPVSAELVDAAMAVGGSESSQSDDSLGDLVGATHADEHSATDLVLAQDLWNE